MKKLIIITLLISTLGLSASEEPVKKDTADRIKYLEIGDKTKGLTKRRKLMDIVRVSQVKAEELGDSKSSAVDESNSSVNFEYFESLPPEMIVKIVNQLPDKDLFNFAQTSKRHRNIALPEIKKRTEAQNKFFKDLAGNSDILDLLNENITYIFPGAFKDLGSLKWLYLDRNQLTKIESGAFKGLDNLKKLYLYRNQLTKIEPGAFKDLGSLKYLSLDNNQLTKIEPGAFKGLDNLKRLNLIDNKLTKIEPGAFKDLGSLRELFLNRNKLTEIAPEAFQGLDNLKRLWLDNNKLTEENKKALRKALPSVEISF